MEPEARALSLLAATAFPQTRPAMAMVGRFCVGMETIVHISTVVTIGVYGAMLAICCICAYGVQIHRERREFAEAERDKAIKDRHEARRAEAVIGTELCLAQFERQRAIDEAKEARAKVQRLYSAGTDLAQKVGWQPTKVMGGAEYRVYQDLNAIVTEAATGHHLFPQVACHAFLQAKAPSDRSDLAHEANHVLHRKYVDFLLVDWRGVPRAVIEYQGAGHYRANAYDRDQAKRIACHKAGIAFIEVPEAGLQPAQRAAVLEAMGLTHSVAAE